MSLPATPQKGIASSFRCVCEGRVLDDLFWSNWVGVSWVHCYSLTTAASLRWWLRKSMLA